MPIFIRYRFLRHHYVHPRFPTAHSITSCHLQMTAPLHLAAVHAASNTLQTQHFTHNSLVYGRITDPTGDISTIYGRPSRNKASSGVLKRPFHLLDPPYISEIQANRALTTPHTALKLPVRGGITPFMRLLASLFFQGR